MSIILKDLIKERLDLERSKGRVFDVSRIDVRKGLDLYEIYGPYEKAYYEETSEGRVRIVTLSDDAPEEAWETAMLCQAWFESPYYEAIR